MIDLRPFMVGAGVGFVALVFLPLSGILPIAATPGSWPVVDWYFNLAAQQSITLRSIITTVPDLDQPGMVERGAGHYEMVCADCHGSPAAPPQQFAENISPTPPLLVQRMAQWHPNASVFTTVKYGIRHTAMPGWPTPMRDDEVWDMVAFIQTLPRQSAEDYASLAGLRANNSCASCHGETGVSAIPGTPRLDIQTPQYLEASLRAFRAGTRHSGTMMAAARTLSDEQIIELAAFYGKSVAADVAPGTSEASVIVRLGLPDRDVPACDSCHGANARPGYPRLYGQNPDYLLRQLELFKLIGSERGGDNAHIMVEAVRGLEADQIAALAQWYGGQEITRQPAELPTHP